MTKKQAAWIDSLADEERVAVLFRLVSGFSQAGAKVLLQAVEREAEQRSRDREERYPWLKRLGRP